MKTTLTNRLFVALLALFVIAPAALAQETPAVVPPPADKPAPAPEKPKTEYVQMTISGAVEGDIILELTREKAPISTDNFLAYVDKKFYDGVIFHRVISTFMIQGGGFTADMTQKQTDAPIKNEWKNGLKNARGTIAMARTNVADSATSQFFINVVDNNMLDQPRDGAAYAVFGKVVAGMDVVDAIKVVPVTSRAGQQTVPVEAVVIEKAVRISEEDAKKKMDAQKKPDAAAPASPQ